MYNVVLVNPERSQRVDELMYKLYGLTPAYPPKADKTGFRRVKSRRLRLWRENRIGMLEYWSPPLADGIQRSMVNFQLSTCSLNPKAFETQAEKY